MFFASFFVTIGVVFFILYMVGVFAYAYAETIYNVKWHDDCSFFGGYMTNSNRDAVPRDVRRGLIWPILLVIWIVKACIWMANDLLGTLFLAINFKYTETRVYKYLDKIDP